LLPVNERSFDCILTGSLAFISTGNENLPGVRLIAEVVEATLAPGFAAVEVVILGVEAFVAVVKTVLLLTSGVDVEVVIGVVNKGVEIVPELKPPVDFLLSLNVGFISGAELLKAVLVAKGLLLEVEVAEATLAPEFAAVEVVILGVEACVAGVETALLLASDVSAKGVVVVGVVVTDLFSETVLLVLSVVFVLAGTEVVEGVVVFALEEPELSVLVASGVVDVVVVLDEVCALLLTVFEDEVLSAVGLLTVVLSVVAIGTSFGHVTCQKVFAVSISNCTQTACSPGLFSIAATRLAASMTLTSKLVEPSSIT